MLDITGLMMLAEAEPKPHCKRNESACGASVAHFVAWVGPLCQKQAAVFAIDRPGKALTIYEVNAVTAAAIHLARL